MPSQFVHLHAHSEFSLLDGSIKVEKLVKRAVELDMPAVALTDHGNMFGMIHFYRAARKHGIKPILGMEAYITRGSRHDRTRHAGEKSQTDHLILLARNLTGYHNLVKLSSIAFTEGFYYKPRIDFEVLQEHSEGLIGTTACLRGTVAQHALHEGYERAKETTQRYRDIFGHDNYYLEIQDHGIDAQRDLLPIYDKLHSELGIPMIASNDVHYLRKEDSQAHEVLLCLQTGSTLDDPGRFRFSSEELYFKTEQEMKQLFPNHHHAVERTLEVAEKCNVELEEGRFFLPKFPLPEGFASNADYLRHLAYEGATKRYGEVTDPIRDRLDFELGVIQKMDFPGYFLIVRDIVNYAKEQEIPVGPGRGSAAGSLVTYSVGITDVDPLEHNLLFERMLNPERVSMPDIDIDFCFERRDEVIRYVIDRYSADNVCQIITFGTMAARAAVKDVGRVLNIPFADVDRVSKLIPALPGTSLQDSLEKIPELNTLVKSSSEYERLVDLSLTLEGISRHASTHAAGIVITPTPLINHVPLFRSNKGEITTQYDMKAIDIIGLLKIDVLGLRTLTVISKSLAMIEQNYGVRMKIADIPLSDEKTYELLRSGNTVGVFQLESSGMRELLRNLKPTVFSDVTAVNALYRPGPLNSGMVSYFVDCKHGREEIRYEHPMLEPILRDTYGVILYQEQVMQIANQMAGFSLGQSDVLRKAMGKKQADVMEEQKKLFIEGAVNNDIPKALAEKIFGLMEKFAQYGFNKSHSAAYAMISVQTAYLKANYPAEFMAASMTSEIDNTDRILVFMDDAKRMEIPIVPPDVNGSEVEFRAKDGGISYGLGAIKGVGPSAMQHLVDTRELDGAYRSLEDVACRVNLRTLNRRGFESLIMAGAMDNLPGHRAQKMMNLDNVLESAQRRARDAERGQSNLFGESEVGDQVPMQECDEWTRREELHNEREAIGFFLTGHPLERFKDLLAMMSNVTSRNLSEQSGGRERTFGGLVTQVKTILDRKGQPMAFVTMEDRHGTAEVIVFSDLLEKHRQHVVEDAVLLLRGKVSSRGGSDAKLIVNSIVSIDEDHFPVPKEVHFTINLDDTGESDIDRLQQMIDAHQGDTKVFFHIKEAGRRQYVIRSKSKGLQLDYEIVSTLTKSIGSENIKLVPAGRR